MDWFEIIFLVIAIIFGILRMFFGNNSFGNIGFAFDEVDLGNEKMDEIH